MNAYGWLLLPEYLCVYKKLPLPKYWILLLNYISSYSQHEQEHISFISVALSCSMAEWSCILQCILIAISYEMSKYKYPFEIELNGSRKLYSYKNISSWCLADGIQSFGKLHLAYVVVGKIILIELSTIVASYTLGTSFFLLI